MKRDPAPTTSVSSHDAEKVRGCEKCDALRRRQDTPQLVGAPCDICGGRGFDYLGRPCRHGAHIDGGDAGGSMDE